MKEQDLTNNLAAYYRDRYLETLKRLCEVKAQRDEWITRAGTYALKINKLENKHEHISVQ